MTSDGRRLGYKTSNVSSFEKRPYLSIVRGRALCGKRLRVGKRRKTLGDAHLEPTGHGPRVVDPAMKAPTRNQAVRRFDGVRNAKPKILVDDGAFT